MAPKTSDTEEPEVTEEETTETGEDTETGRIHSIADLNEKVNEILSKIGSLGRGPRQTQADQSADVAQQVKSEVGKLKAAEDAERRRQGLRGEIDALKEQVKTLSERAPVEYRRITKWMWGDE